MSQTSRVPVVATSLLVIMMVLSLAAYLQASELSTPDMLEIDYHGPETHPWSPPEFHPLFKPLADPKSQPPSKSDAARKETTLHG
ncbi:uncharacterized protein LOC141842370 isoform X1 [Curcuma longa]|uniref:uncharacterized protein LOC141842370 isoform X1 n=1 Tax=Curcuma longa TaxID=136217 RepID=UPI003D9E393A